MTISEIKTLINDLIDTNSTDFPDVKKVRLLNKAQDKVVNLIMEYDGKQEWDDDNYTDFNEGYLDIVSGQNDYSFKEDENFANVLLITNVYIKESPNSTDYVELQKVSKFSNEDTGIPRYYRITGKNLIFAPTFNYSLTDGIKVQFIRVPQPISISDTTKEPGIPSTFHYLLVLYACYDFARAKNLTNRNEILQEIIQEERRLGLFVAEQAGQTVIGKGDYLIENI